jgi:hypothetical protein
VGPVDGGWYEVRDVGDDGCGENWYWTVVKS